MAEVLVDGCAKGVGEEAGEDAPSSSTIPFEGSVRPFASNVDSCLISVLFWHAEFQLLRYYKPK